MEETETSEGDMADSGEASDGEVTAVNGEGTGSIEVDDTAAASEGDTIGSGEAADGEEDTGDGSGES